MKNINKSLYHQSKKGSSAGLTVGLILSESGYEVKQLVSPAPFVSGIYGALISLFNSLLQFRLLKNLWFLMSATPFFKLPYLLDKSA